MLRALPASVALVCLMILAVGCARTARDKKSAKPEAKKSDAKLAASYYAEPGSPPPMRPDEGVGPGQGGDKFDKIVENPFIAVKTDSRSTFSIDVDTAAYSKVRQYLMENRTMPPPAAVRIEELINYFTYDYDTPTGEHPFQANVETAQCPWKSEHRLARIGIKGREIEKEGRPASNLVFLLDVSGSMDYANKLPLLKRGMKIAGGRAGRERPRGHHRLRSGRRVGARLDFLRPQAGDYRRPGSSPGGRLHRRRSGHQVGLPGRPGQLHQGRHQPGHPLH